MPLLLLLAALAVLAAISVVAAGPGASMATTSPDRSPGGELPVDDVDRAALDGLRFSLAFRGYRMDEVDAVIDRLATELELRDSRIAELEGPAAPPPPSPPSPPPSQPSPPSQPPPADGQAVDVADEV